MALDTHPLTFTEIWTPSPPISELMLVLSETLLLDGLPFWLVGHIVKGSILKRGWSTTVLR